MAIIDDILSQNRGVANGLLPVGLPPDYNWYKHGWGMTGLRPPRAGDSACTGYFHCFPMVGQPNPPAGASLIVRKFDVWLHRKSGGWFQVQNLAGSGFGGGYFKAAISPANESAPGSVRTKLPDGTWKVTAPRHGTMTHCWPEARGTFPAGTVDGSFVDLEMKSDNPAAKLIVQTALDWWASAGAQFPNNLAEGLSDWQEVTGAYKRFMYTMLPEAKFRADPPPFGAVVPPVVVPPVEPPAPGIPGPKGDTGPAGPAGPAGPGFIVKVDGKPLPSGSIITIEVK